MEQVEDEPQTNADQHVQHVESVEPTWTREKDEPQKRCDECIHFDKPYKKRDKDGMLIIGVECDGMDEPCDKWTDEPQTDCPWK